MTGNIVLKARLLDVKDVMTVCRCGRDEAYQLIAAAGRVRLGRSVRCRPEDLDAVLVKLLDEGRAD